MPTRAPSPRTRLIPAAAIAAGALALTADPAVAAFPGDNGRIAFADAPIDDSGLVQSRSQIRTIVPAGGDVRALTPARGFATDPAYSPDGRRIAYVRRAGTRDTEIAVMRADGSRSRTITRNRVEDRSPAWSPDGKRIVFVRDLANGRDAILTVRRDGRGTRRLTGSGLTHEAPAWSPDGRWIAFMRMNRRGQTAIYRMRSNGRGVRHVVAGEFPSWSPDGRWLAFDRHTTDPGLREIFTIRPNGRDARRVTHDQLDDVRPAWSPDGEWIAFTRDATKIFRVRAGGGDEQLVVAAPEAAEDLSSYELLGFPSWQPR